MSDPQADPGEPSRQPPPRKIHLFGVAISICRARAAADRHRLGLVVLGILGFLPILGFWMIPLGLLVLSYEFASVRRRRRRLVVWWERRKAARG